MLYEGYYYDPKDGKKKRIPESPHSFAMIGTAAMVFADIFAYHFVDFTGDTAVDIHVDKQAYDDDGWAAVIVDGEKYVIQACELE